MKFLAILKDSLREALDTKVFYVMVGFSLLVVLFIGSIGYRPVAVEEETQRMMDQMSWFLARFSDKQHLGPAPHWSIQDFERTNPGSEPWQSGYRFALTVEFAEEKQADEERKMQKTSLDQLQRVLRQQMPYLKNLKVAQDKEQNPKEVRFRVTADENPSARPQDWPHYPVILFLLPIRIIHLPINTYVQVWESWIVNWIGAAVALLISTIITAFFIPNMLRKGTVDLLLVKPISRPALLLYKYVGGMTFIFLNTIVVVVGIWLMLGLRTNLWGIGFLISIPVLTFQFAMYYAVSTLFAVVSRSPIVAILMTCLWWFVFAVLIGQGYSTIDVTRTLPSAMRAELEKNGGELASDEKMPEKPFPDWVYTSADVVHFVTPHLKDLDKLTDKWILDDAAAPESRERKAADKVYENFRWTETVAVTSVYIVVLLGLSCLWFAWKDY